MRFCCCITIIKELLEIVIHQFITVNYHIVTKRLHVSHRSHFEDGNRLQVVKEASKVILENNFGCAVVSNHSFTHTIFGSM